jgi:hypothetical protein
MIMATKDKYLEAMRVQAEEGSKGDRAISERKQRRGATGEQRWRQKETEMDWEQETRSKE